MKGLKTRAAILWNRKNGPQNFVMIFKTLHFDKNLTKREVE